jgi:[CysO sulfur-carrier protein]-S-L-cysteine hydrolase
VVGLKKLVLPSNLWADMKNDVSKKDPEEACGILAGCRRVSVYQAQAVFPMENILHSPRRFRMDPQMQVEQILFIQSQNLEIVAIYHSHPRGGALPSDIDRAEVYDPAAINLIWHPAGENWECCAYLIQEGLWEIPIEIHTSA